MYMCVHVCIHACMCACVGYSMGLLWAGYDSTPLTLVAVNF